MDTGGAAVEQFPDMTQVFIFSSCLFKIYFILFHVLPLLPLFLWPIYLNYGSSVKLDCRDYQNRTYCDTKMYKFVSTEQTKRGEEIELQVHTYGKM